MRAATWVREHLPSPGWMIFTAVLSIFPAVTLAIFGYGFTQPFAAGMHTAGNGALFATLSALTIVPVLVTRAMDNHRRKIQVEEKLDVVMVGVSEVHDMLSKKAPQERPEFTVIPGGKA